MVYFCNGCGNHADFEGRQDITQTGYESITFDEEGENIDCHSTDIQDSDVEGDIYDISCSDCSSHDVITIDREEIPEYLRAGGFPPDNCDIEDDDSYIKSMPKVIDNWQENIK